MAPIRTAWPRAAALALLVWIVWAPTIAAQGASADEPHLEDLLQQAWRWRELQRDASTPSFHSAFATRDGRLVVTDRDGLWIYDGVTWTQPPGGGLLAGQPAEILDATERGSVVLVYDTVYGLPSDWEGPADGALPTRDDLALGLELPPGMTTGFGRLPNGTPIALYDDQIVSLTPDAVQPILDVPPDWKLVTCVTADVSGRIWCLTEQGPWVRDAGTWRLKALPRSVGRPEVLSRATTLGNQLYFLPEFFDRRYQAFVWDGQGLQPVAPLPGGGRVTSVGSTRHRELVVALEGPGLWLLRGGVWRPAPIPEPFGETVVQLDFFEDGRLVAVTQSGCLLLCDLASTRWQVHDPSPQGVSSIVNALAPSRRGGLWLGTHSGIIRWNGQEFVDAQLDVPELGINLNEVTALAEDAAGDLWVGSGSGFRGALRFDGERWHLHQEPDGVGQHFVHVIRPGPDGELWFGLLANELADWDRGAIVRRDAEGRWERFEGDVDNPGVRAYDFAWSADGELYAGLRSSVARFDGQLFERLPDTSVGNSESAFALHFDRQDDLWVGFGLADPGIAERSARGWLRHGSGEWLSAGAADFAETADGSLWMTSDFGLHHYKDGILSEVDARGVMSSPSFWPVLPTDDGRGLWLGSRGSGLVRYTPDDDTPPRVIHAATHRPSNLSERVRVATWSGADAWAVTRPEQLRFSFRMDDDAWSPWALQTVDPSARVSQLPSGEHVLSVRALDGSGNVSVEPYTSTFEVPPPVWARPPMIVALSLLVMAVVLLSQASVRRRRERREAERELGKLNDQLRHLTGELLSSQEDERRSLAQDLHDDLGQLLTATCLHVQHAAKVDDVARRTEALERAHESVKLAIDSVRNVVTRLRPPLLDDLGLEVAVSSTLDDYRRATGLEVDSTIRLNGLQFPDNTASHVFRIVNECLTNIARHASARRVEVYMETEDGVLRLRVRDDGHGFDVDSATNGMGLLGMRERAETLGGRLSIRSVAGRGTTIRASIPVAEGAATDLERRADDSWTRTESSSWTTT